jgi:hypothetical protein
LFKTVSRKIRVLLASTAALAGIGTFVAACGLALSPRRKQRVAPNTPHGTTAIQQLTRYRTADGAHSIHGTLLAELEPGERSTTIHIAFCPPFERLPTVEAEAVDDSSATVKLSQVLHNGVQIDVRLPEPAEDKYCITIEMTATDFESS